MRFRPLPILSFFTLVCLGILCWLGVWQFERSAWKVEQIDSYKERAASPAVTLAEALCGEGSPVGRPVDPGQPKGAPRLRIYGFSNAGAPGWRQFAALPAPACLGDRKDVLVEMAFQPFQTDDIVPIRRVRVEPWPDKRPTFASDNQPATGDWYWFDAPAMAATLLPGGDVELDTRYYLVADDGLPDYLRRVPPERHIGYSVTWFGLAISLAVLYVAFHIRAGRLTFGKPEDD